MTASLENQQNHFYKFIGYDIFKENNITKLAVANINLVNGFFGI
jgi:hypothetical protein